MKISDQIQFEKLEHSGGRRCCRRFAKLRPVKMSVPSSSVAAGLKLDSGINYVKCAAAVQNNASIEPIYRPNCKSHSRAPVLLENSLDSSSNNGSISISGPSGDDLLQQVQQKRQQYPENYNSSPQSRPRGRRRGRRRPKCVWMWRRWFNSLPSLVSSLLVSVPAKPSIHSSQLRAQQKRCKSQNSYRQIGGCSTGSGIIVSGSVARNVLEEKEEEEENGNPSALMGDSDCESSDYSSSSVRSRRQRWKRSAARSCHQSSTTSVLGRILGGIDVKLVLVIMVLIGVIDYSEAGTCWLRRMESTGKCNKLFARNVSRENCCHAGTGLGYSDRDITDVQLFFVNAFKDGMDCASCLDSCEKAMCGVNKRCVMKKGRPKCVCAPNCKASKQGKQLPNQNIKVINLSDSQRNRRQYFSSGPRAAASRMGPPSSRSGGGSNNKRSVRLVSDEPSSRQHHSRTVKTSLSEKTLSQRSSNGKVANSKHKDNLLETVTLVNSRSRGDGGSHKANRTERLSDRMVLMADGPVQVNSYARKSRSESKPILVTSSSANVRHRNRKVSSNDFNQTLEGSYRPQSESKQQHHSRDFGKPRLLRLDPSDKDNRTVDARIIRRRPPSHLEEMFYVPANRRSRMRVHDFDFGNEITQHVGFYNPVCGTDGKTYKTECQLKKRACRQESTTLVMAYKGHCQTSCRFVQCPDGKHCVEDQNATPHCVTCTMDCPPVESRSTAKAVVCGTDGNTYRNICELKRKACLTGRAIPVAYRGRCIETATCDTIKCKDRQQCLTDLQTHKPRCVSCSYKCPRAKRLQQTRTRQFGGSNGDGQGQHNRQSQLHQQTNIKLCGTNNHTYHSWCHMLRDSCNTGFYIDVQYNGVCSFDRRISSSTILTHSTNP
ncbi:uncharacterized protein LOC134209478 isoform X2 [Armigeres subalbatus]|uniref:uncharacterized protein LOC134209478 isoform X2 n=1 Tax=Armigeres subalbatus TaxID=124917 RepID=UPI002ED6A0CB